MLILSHFCFLFVWCKKNFFVSKLFCIMCIQLLLKDLSDGSNKNVKNGENIFRFNWMKRIFFNVLIIFIYLIFIHFSSINSISNNRKITIINVELLLLVMEIFEESFSLKHGTFSFNTSIFNWPSNNVIDA